ncbi:hypothetical protein NPS53_09165 [Pseudomonas putida]|uniref:hypothetical protein n=1 Tax=Pseudomonas putida TaxID=303 RepID=UPI0023648E55|nr:hypothetical protein [Pseudomonas putida]MDD2139745.1 hypothetical protein [Pseudomonas putida]HDS1721669.1 hypothetical protein [Pseudomonas putida]
MTDAYVFEIHPACDVILSNGRETVRPRYTFDKGSLSFAPNSDPDRTVLTCGRHKSGGILACIAIMQKDQFRGSVVPEDCYVERSC